nr:ATP-grasp domain-containing protein [Pandoraea nosoerga]
MDAAIPSIARLAGKDFGGGRIVGPSLQGAEISLNKALTSEFCEQVSIRHPRRYFSNLKEKITVIAKPIEGFGGKGIHILGPDQHHLLSGLESTHIIQELIRGAETTHDLYIDEKGNVHASSRDRLAVIDGEVDHCVVRQPRESEMAVFDKIARSGLFWGPLTVQTFQSDSGETVLIEINARLGGGVTASIAAGFPVIELFVEESFGISLPRREFRPLEMKRARRDFYRFIA